MTQRRLLLLGPPGTGKTTRLLAEMERRLKAGTPPSRIVFVSFTRAAIKEAKDRACDEFNLVHDDLPLMRTLHSMAFYLLSLRRGDVFGREALADLADLTGEELTGKLELDAPTLGERGDALLALDQYARSALVPLEDAWQAHGATLDWYRVKRFVDMYDGLKRQTGLIDFTDMIERAVASHAAVDADVAFVDEAQDLTPLQWRLVESAFRNVPELIVSGDDDQNIYAWAGASSTALLEFRGEKEVLAQSFRLPRAVWRVAQDVAGGIGQRYQKAFLPAEREGAVEWLARPDEIDLASAPERPDPDKLEWLLLARTRRQLIDLVTEARDQGVIYVLGDRSSADPEHVAEIVDYERFRAGDPSMPMWHDALASIPLETREYYLACLRRNKRALNDRPRVRITTIHGAKGLEAYRVLLLTDLNARILQGAELDPDAEQRVLYVGVTRAMEDLYLVEPKGGRGYEL